MQCHLCCWACSIYYIGYTCLCRGRKHKLHIQFTNFGKKSYLFAAKCAKISLLQVQTYSVEIFVMATNFVWLVLQETQKRKNIYLNSELKTESDFDCPTWNYRMYELKFSFSEKVTKICAILLMVLHMLSKRKNHKGDCPNFCGLLRKAALYSTAECLLIKDFSEIQPQKEC